MKSMRMMTDSLLRFGLILSVSAFMLSGCTKKHGDEDADSQTSSPAVVAVKTASITEGNIDDIVTATGKTDALRKEKIFSPVAGRILTLNVLEATPVSAGDVIAIIQTKESHAAIAGAEALLKSAKTPAEVKEAQRTLELAQSTQSTVSVRAKFNGIVSMRNVSEGELVAENAELLTLLDLSSVVFTADVMLRDLPPLHVGQLCTIQFQSLPNQRFRAKLDAINPQTDVQSQTVKVRLGFTDLSATSKASLKTDMAGTARIVTHTRKNVLLVPKPALLRNDENNTFSVVVVTADSLARTVQVSIGASGDSTIEILSGELRKGMNVITEGSYALIDSTRVAVVK